MNTIDKATAEALMRNTAETQDGMFAFMTQAMYALDMCVHSDTDFEVFQIDVYTRKPEYMRDNSIMNFSYMTASATSLYDEFSLIETHYFDNAVDAHAGFAELAKSLNHF